MSTQTRTTIIKKATAMFALSGYEGFSIRSLAEQIPVAPSVMYHYFADKDALLKEMYETQNRTLGQKRTALITPPTASQMLKERIAFQIDNQEAIVAVLKYYLAYRQQFKRTTHGFVPNKTALHIEEVLVYGNQTKEFAVKDIENDAKVITHAINGFLLEYFPHTPKGKEKIALIETIYAFLIRALKNNTLDQVTKGGEKK